MLSFGDGGEGYRGFHARKKDDNGDIADEYSGREGSVLWRGARSRRYRFRLVAGIDIVVVVVCSSATGSGSSSGGSSCGTLRRSTRLVDNIM